MTQTQTQEEAIAGYLDRLAEFVGWCARYRRDEREPEVFLWNARRALEAICLLVEECAEDVESSRSKKRRAKSRSDNGESLYSTLKRLESRGLLQDAFPALDSIRQNSNLGVHVQGPERPAYRTATPACADALFQAVRWVIEYAPFASRLPKPKVSAVRRALTDLVHDQIPTPSEELEEAQERATSAEKTVHQLRARASERPPPAKADGAGSVTGGVRRARNWALVFVLAAAAFAAGFAARSAETSGTSATTDDPRDGGPGGNEGERSATDASAEERELRVTPAYVNVGAEDAGTDAGTTRQRTSVDSPSWRCPEGMRLMDGGTLRIGQPVGGRGDWPQARPLTIADIHVPPFCIDERATSARELPPGTSHTPQCNWHRTAVAVCIDASEAASICGRRGARLPKISEWEWVARHARPALSHVAEAEWAEDLFPPAIFNRRPRRCTEALCRRRMFRGGLVPSRARATRGRVLYSWNQHGEDGFATLGFRCVVEPQRANEAAPRSDF